MATNRTVGQQVRSGLRLAGFVLLTIALYFLLIYSTILLAGKNQNSTELHRVLGGCILLALATLMFFSIRHWAKWFVAIIGYLILKTSVSFLLGRTPSVPSIARPRLIFLEYLLTFVAAGTIFFKFFRQVPRKIDTLALVAFFTFVGFSYLSNTLPPLVVLVV